MSSSEAAAAEKKAEEAKVKAAEMARAAAAARAEADAAEKAAEEARMNKARAIEENVAMTRAEEGMARRLAAKEKAAKAKVSAAKAAWERARDEMRNFTPIEAVIRPVVYRAVLAAASAKRKDGNPVGFPDREDSLDRVERAIELLSGKELDPMAEQVPDGSNWGEGTKPNPWRDLTQNERIAWNVVKKEMKGYMKAREALDSAVFAAYEAATEAAEAEMERLCEAAKVDMHWYGSYDYTVGDPEIKRMVRWCLAATAMPDADEIVCQIRSSISILQELDVFFETHVAMTLLRYERFLVTNGRGNNVMLHLGDESDTRYRFISSDTVRHIHSTLRRLKETADGLETVHKGRPDGKQND